jgi:hypothetical protein
MEEMTSNAVDSDDDLDWEEVQVPEHQHDFEITLQTHSKPDKSTNKFVVILNSCKIPSHFGQEERNTACRASLADQLP